ncbi:MAG: hypothetical protein M9955_13565 [Rhizobiaceae bacterium]|nr:hypothetical protein [Rhizobiaceae bacterium]
MTKISEQGLAVYRHRRRGTEYLLVGFGRMQAESWLDGSSPERNAGDLYSIDMREVAIYRGVADGRLWVRPREEFEGRFDLVTARETGAK